MKFAVVCINCERPENKNIYSQTHVSCCKHKIVYEYGHEQVKLRKRRCNNKEFLLKIDMLTQNKKEEGEFLLKINMLTQS